MLAIAAIPAAVSAQPVESPQFSTMPLEGLPPEPGVNRRDPSDIIRRGEDLLVFYTRVERGAPVYPEGYAGAIFHAVSKDEGRTWTEVGQALGPGRPGDFDSFGVFTPNVVAGLHGGYFLFYTGVGDGFDNRDQSDRNRTAIGVVELAFNEAGHVTKTLRLNGGEPVLEPSPVEDGKFDSFRVDDAAVVTRDDRYLLYYKGRDQTGGPAGTRMGVAVSSEIEGPYVRLYDGNPVQPEGHEVLVWSQGAGVFSLASAAGSGLYYAPDAAHFTKLTDSLSGTIHAPGAFRPDLSDHVPGGPPAWGISMEHAADPYLVRWEADWGALNTAVIPVRGFEDRAAAAGWTQGGDWLDQHGEIDRLCARGPVDVVLLGDSITQSWGGQGRNVWSPGQEAWRKAFGDLRVANAGISGDRTEHLLWRIGHGRLHQAKPTVVILTIGTNNLPFNSAAETAEGIEAVVDALLVRLPASRILLMGILPRGATPDDPLRRKARQVNERIQALGTWPRVVYRDPDEGLLLEDGTLNAKYFAQDNLHLTAEGYEAWARLLEPDLRRLVK